MPGFGQGPFGSQPFGQWPWSRQVLYDLLPGLYKQQDELVGSPLETWTESLRYDFDLMTDLIANWSTLRDPLKVRTAYDETTTIVLGPNVTPPAPIEQRGVDGSVNASKQFVSPTARFQISDVGKKLTLSNSNISINNRTFVLATIVNPTTVVCDPPLVTDTGPIRWQLQGFTPLPDDVMAFEVHGGDVSAVAPGWILFDGFSQFEVYERQQFFPVSGQTKTLTEEDGTQGQVLDDGTFQAEVDFDQTNVGQPFSVSGSVVTATGNDFTNNGKYQIYAVDPSDPSILTFHAPLTIQSFSPAGVPDPDSAVIYTMTNGQTGIEVTHINYGTNITLFVIVAGNQISVYLGTDALGNVTSTAAQVVAAVNGSVAAAALVTASLSSGSAGGDLVVTSPFQTIPGSRLLPDAGPLTWSLLPFPQLQLLTSSSPAGVTVQQGVDLILNGSTASATTAKFTQADVGNLLEVFGSILGSDQIYKIVAFIDTTSVQVSPALAVSGSAASISAFTNPLVTLTGLSGITPSLVGQFLSVSGAATAASNGVFQIITYFSATSVAVENPSGTGTDTNNGAIVWSIVDTGTATYPHTNLTWAEHIPSAVGDGTQALLHAPSLIDFLAQDFGITIDERESESRQRSWVANVTQWIGLKGTAKSYEIIGAISGFDVEIQPLYRISQALSQSVPDTSLYIVGETDEGRSGNDGYLTLAFGFVVFTSPTAAFQPSDVGLNIELTHCSAIPNNAVYTIYEYISPTSVAFSPGTIAFTPDYGLGGAPGSPTITWEVNRLYTTQDPTHPLFDDVNVELMQEVVGVPHFLIDSYCWQPAFTNSIPIQITAVSPTTSSGVPIYYEVTAQGVSMGGGVYSTLGVVGDVGHWEVTDNSSQHFFIEPPASPIQSVTIGTGNAALTFTATVAGNTSISITIVSGIGLSVTVYGQQLTIAVTGATTAAQVVAAIEGYAPSNTLVEVEAGGDGSGVVSPVSQTYLEGGITPVLPVSPGPPPVHTFRVYSSQVPALGSATLTYNCPIVTTCTYCRAAAVLALVTEGSIASENGLAIEDVFNRVIARLEDEVKPIHVRLIPVFQRTLQASLNITAQIVANIEVHSVMLAPEQAYHDLLGGDMFAPDYVTHDLGGGAANITSFSSPNATLTFLGGLTADMVGSAITVAGAASSGNNGRFTISSYISATSCTIYNPNAVAGDANNGKIEWIIENTGLRAQIDPPPSRLPGNLWVADGGDQGAGPFDARFGLIRVIDPSTLSLVRTIDVTAYLPTSGGSPTGDIRMLRLSADGQHVFACVHTFVQAGIFVGTPGRVIVINASTYAVEGIAQMGSTAAGFNGITGARDCVDTGDGNLWVNQTTGGNTATEFETFNIATVIANGPGTPTTSFQQLVITNHSEEMCFGAGYIWTGPGNYSHLITRVDPTSNTATTQDLGFFFYGCSFHFGALWGSPITGNSITQIIRMDPAQFGTGGFVTDTVTLHTGSGGPEVYNGFASDGTNLWVTPAFAGLPGGSIFEMYWWQLNPTGGSVSIINTVTETSTPGSEYNDGSQSSGAFDGADIWFVRWLAEAFGGPPSHTYPGICQISPAGPILVTSVFNGGAPGYWVGPRNLIFVPT